MPSWYVVWVHPNGDIKDLAKTYHVVQLASPPADGAQYQGGFVVQVQGPYASQSAAEQAIGASSTSGQGGLPSSPDTSSPQANKGVNLLGGLAGIGDFFARLTEASTWVRVAEVVLGLGLFIVGLAKFASGTDIGRAAASAGKAAAIL